MHNGIGHASHKPDISSSEHHTDAALGKAFAKQGRTVEVGLRRMVAGAAVNGYIFDHPG